MKKFIVFLLSICFMLGVVGCGTNYDKEKAEATQSKLSL